MNLDFNIIINIIETRRQNALILMYWDFGKYGLRALEKEAFIE